MLMLPQDTKEFNLGKCILVAVIWPLAAKTAGVPLKFEHEMATGTFMHLPWTFNYFFRFLIANLLQPN